MTIHSIRENQQSLRILLAEDNPVNMRLATVLLRKRGHSVIGAANGNDVLRLMDGHHVDLVLMDVQMPELDGFEATKVIRQREIGTGIHIPIVALTARAIKGDRERCLEAGMDDYLAKPIQPAELDAMLGRLISPAD